MCHYFNRCLTHKPAKAEEYENWKAYEQVRREQHDRTQLGAAEMDEDDDFFDDFFEEDEEEDDDPEDELGE